jgi:hypothetical protein
VYQSVVIELLLRVLKFTRFAKHHFVMLVFQRKSMHLTKTRHVYSYLTIRTAKISIKSNECVLDYPQIVPYLGNSYFLNVVSNDKYVVNV